MEKRIHNKATYTMYQNFMFQHKLNMLNGNGNFYQE